MTRWERIDIHMRSLSLAAMLSASSCASTGGGFDVLHQPAPVAQRAVGGVALSPADYETVLRWGEWWFRTETFGGERAITDVAGMFGAEIEVPCGPQNQAAGAGCRRRTTVLPYLIEALDRLDGVEGNLFAGNGGVLGPGYASDLVIDFPPDTTLAGLPVPRALHTGLEVDAGSPWPVGLVAVKAPAGDEGLPYLIEPAALGAGPAPPGKYRLGITCALCHYSLDIDKDGQPDLRSTRWDDVTAGAAWQPRDTWGVGNHDIQLGWLFALARNPLVGVTVLSGPVGRNRPQDATAWIRWIKQRYRTDPEGVRREVVRGMIVQPVGSVDDTANALHDPNQIPMLFTLGNWPFNFDGSFVAASDRNNGVWTGAIDFTGLIALASDRSSSASSKLFWEPPPIYAELTAEEYADLMVDQSPAVAANPGLRRPLKDDILGTSDGIPGLLRPDNMVVVKNALSSLPDAVFNHRENVVHHRIRQPAEFGPDGLQRASMMVLLGTRVISTPEVRRQPQLVDLFARYPGVNADEFESDAVSAMLDWLKPPVNRTPVLARARGLVERGYQLFKEAGCASCHAGPFLTNNAMNRLYARRAKEFGIAAPSTSGFRALGRGSGAPIKTAPYRSLANRPLQLFVASSYDPGTGRATEKGGVLQGLFGDRPVGYKTPSLRSLWNSAPYLHDGGVAVAVRPNAGPPEDDLATLLGQSDGNKMFGMASIVVYRHDHQSGQPSPNAPLSLQALLLSSERQKVVSNNHAAVVPVPIGQAPNPLGAPAQTSLALLGIEGTGHEFWIDDRPGGERITALIAFLLAIDDSPGDLP